MSPPALRMQGVVKRYGRRVALDGLSLEVPAGSVTGLVGPNGAGKTTAFGVVGGAVRPLEGEIDLLGGGPFDAARHAGRLGMLPQDCGLHADVPVRVLLVHFARLQGMGRAQAGLEADRVLDAMDLSDRADSKVGQLSHGMRRRVQVGQAFLGKPELILLDEPTNGLDPDLVVRVRSFFRTGRQGATLVISSHVLVELEAICDHVIFMEQGRAVRQGSMAAITGQRAVVRVHLEGGPDAAALARVVEQELPGLLAWEEEGALMVEDPAGEGAAALNARVLPVLWAAGGQVGAVSRGQSLEAAWMAQRAEGRGQEA